MTQVVRVHPKPDCPECGTQMTLRRNSKTRMRFWGCADYPQCEGARGIKEDGTAEGDDDLFSLYDEDDHDEQD